MDVTRYEFEIIGVNEPRTIGKKTTEDAVESPSLARRLGLGASGLSNHLGVAAALTAHSALILSYAAFLIIKGALSAASSIAFGTEGEISLADFDKFERNYIALLRENFERS